LRHRLLFAIVIAQLGLVSLVWALVAPLLSLLLPRRMRVRIGRSGISWIYRTGWATAERLGMMEIDSSALDPLSDDAASGAADALSEALTELSPAAVVHRRYVTHPAAGPPAVDGT